MATVEAAALSIFSVYSSSSSSKFISSPKPLSSIKLNPIPYSTPSLSLNFPFSPLPLTIPTRRLCSTLCSTLQEAIAEADANEAEEKTTLWVVDFPSSCSAEDIKTLFSQCGTVKTSEIRHNRKKDGRDYAFVTMASEEQAQAVIQKFHNHEMSGKNITVAFARSYKEFASQRPPQPRAEHIRYRIHVASISYKVRSKHLKEFFSAGFNPISARIVFDKKKGSYGYGFVGFATKEEAEAAISAFDGKEFMGRPLRLAYSDKNVDVTARENEEEDHSEAQPYEPVS